MIGTMTQPESIAILSLLMVGADQDIKLEEISSMLNNPFFAEHVSEKLGDHKVFLQKYNEAKKALGITGLESQALKVLKSAFPALQIKTVALLTLIADADGDFDQKEKELVARVAVELNVTAKDADPELQKMKDTIKQQAEQAVEDAAQKKAQEEKKEAVDNETPEEQ